MTQPALRAAGIVKEFDGKRAVDQVDLLLEPGAVRGLLGPNGAGKTTLLRILFGLVVPDIGQIELFGRQLNDPRHATSALDGVAGFAETPAFYPYLSGRANLELLAKLDGPGAAARIDGALADVELGERGRERVGGYSTGMRQRLGIAAALLRSPRLLLLDEPSSGLDPAGARELGELLRRLAGGGASLLVSSHQTGELERVCDSFTVLDHGRVVWDGTARQLRADAPASAYRLRTSDDLAALELAAEEPGVRAYSDAYGLRVCAGSAALDAFTVALGSSGIAIRTLELLAGPLETMFFSLTGEAATAPGSRLANQGVLIGVR